MIMFNWSLAALILSMLGGLAIVFTLAMRVFEGKSIKWYMLFIPLYWAAFYGLIQII